MSHFRHSRRDARRHTGALTRVLTIRARGTLLEHETFFFPYFFFFSFRPFFPNPPRALSTSSAFSFARRSPRQRRPVCDVNYDPLGLSRCIIKFTVSFTRATRSLAERLLATARLIDGTIER